MFTGETRNPVFKSWELVAGRASMIAASFSPWRLTSSPETLDRCGRLARHGAATGEDLIAAADSETDSAADLATDLAAGEEAALVEALAGAASAAALGAFTVSEDFMGAADNRRLSAVSDHPAAVIGAPGDFPANQPKEVDRVGEVVCTRCSNREFVWSKMMSFARGHFSILTHT